MAEVSNDKIYDLVNSARLEIKGDVLRLEAKFDALEAGRLTRAEGDISRLQVKSATLNTKVYALVAVITLAVNAAIYIVTAVISRK